MILKNGIRFSLFCIFIFCPLLLPLIARSEKVSFGANFPYVKSVKNKPKKTKPPKEEEEMKSLEDKLELLEVIIDQLEQDIDQMEKNQDLKKNKNKETEVIEEEKKEEG